MALSFLPESVLADWIQPGAVVAAAVGGLGLLVSAFRNLETKLEKRIDEVKIEVKASETRQMAAVSDLKTEFKASEERQRSDLQLLRSDVKSLGDKMDDLLLLLAKGAVAPTAGHGP